MATVKFFYPHKNARLIFTHLFMSGFVPGAALTKQSIQVIWFHQSTGVTKPVEYVTLPKLKARMI